MNERNSAASSSRCTSWLPTGLVPDCRFVSRLSAFVPYRELDEDLAYWRLPSGIEVDFTLGDMRLAVEAKAGPRITRDHLKGLRALAPDMVHSRLLPPKRLFHCSMTSLL